MFGKGCSVHQYEASNGLTLLELKHKADYVSEDVFLLLSPISRLYTGGHDYESVL